jgi:hypothetical protein
MNRIKTYIKNNIYNLFYTFLVLLLSLFLIYNNSQFYSGDPGVNIRMIYDYSNGNIYSLYFYGQNYFGNLQIAIFAILSKITGVSFESIIFWEHLFYFLGLYLIAKSINLKNWLYIPYLLFLTFATRHYFWSYNPQGFAFLFFTLALGYFLIKLGLKYKVWNWLIFLLSFSFTISLWYNPMIAILYPISLFVFILSKKINWKDWSLYFIQISGLLAGSVPLILGTIEKNGQNLSFFASTSPSSKRLYLEYLKKYIQEFLLYFQDTGKLNFEKGYLIYFKNSFLDFKNQIGLLVILSIIILLCFIISKFRTYLTEIVFLTCVFLLLIIRGVILNTEYYATVRYTIFFYVLIFSIPFLLLSNLDLIQARLKPLIRFLSLFCIIAGTLFATSNIVQVYQFAYKGSQPYDLILEDLKKFKVKNLYCFNYFEFCGQVGFLARESTNVFFFDDSGDSSSRRNPDAKEKVENSIKSGEKAYSLIPQDMNILNKKELGTYKFREVKKYVLIEGNYLDPKLN